MFWKMAQAAVALSVIWANIYFEVTDNAFIVCAWAFMAAYAVTAFPFWVMMKLKRRDRLSGPVIESAPRIPIDGARRELLRDSGAGGLTGGNGRTSRRS